MTSPISSPGSSLGSSPGLDETVFPLRERLRVAGVPDPRLVFLMATGVGFLPSHLVDPVDVALGELAPDCEPWSGQVLHAGELPASSGGIGAWILEDVSGEPLEREPEAPWMRVLPVWLAAAAGAHLCVHTSAGSALAPRPRGLVLVRDHLNLSGATPLLGLGPSKLGPLFPDLSRLHHEGLRRAALERCGRLGIAVAEGVAACTLGPALETPAERRMLATLGADVSVPGLALPLLAAAHAGLETLAIVAVTDAEGERVAVSRVLEAAAALQPALEDLLLALLPELGATAAGLARESV